MTRIVRWTPVNTLRTPVSNLLDEFVNDIWSTSAASRPVEDAPQVAKPALDILETDSALELRFNLPGVASDAVSIQFDKGVLSISATVEAENENEIEGETSRYLRRERYTGEYRRSLRVPENIDSENASANFENGVLYLHLPKQPEAQPLRIPVKANHN